MKNFSTKKFFTHFKIDLGLSDNEILHLNKFDLPKESNNIFVDYYGGSDSELQTVLFNSLDKIKTNSTETNNVVINVISRTAKRYLKDMNHESMWLALRITHPDDSYGVPRWHTDGRFFLSDVPVYKFVVTLKGSQTRFAKLKDRAKFIALSSQSSENDSKEQSREDWFNNDIDTRERIGRVVEEVALSRYGEGVGFLVGHEDAVIHSEPDLKKMRIFFSVLGGSVDQIESMKKNK